MQNKLFGFSIRLFKWMGLFEKISAVHVLQRFVRMSRVLLPTYISLSNKKNLNEEEYLKVDKIKDIYKDFHADPKTSLLLINSNILELIQNTFNNTESGNLDTPEGFYVFNQFIEESDRLINEWNRQLMN